MSSFKSICAFLAVLTVGTFAHADTYTFSNMTLTQNKGGTKVNGTVTGTVVIDSSGDVTSGDFMATWGGSPTQTFTFDGSPSSATKSAGGSPAYDLTIFTSTTNSAIKFDLEYIFSGGIVTLCTRDTNGSSGNGACDQGGTGQQSFLDSSSLGSGDLDVISGSLVAPVGTAATPEPSSILLLSTGLLGAVGAARRRFVRN